jgi:hypothetical protein
MTENLKYARPETLILWNYLRTTFAITAITPLYFQGAIAGSEFLTYAANKLYFCINGKFNGATAGAVGAGATVTLYNEANAISMYLQNTSMSWNTSTTAQQFTLNLIDVNSLYFSRLANSQYTYMIFNGYRLTL